MNRITFDKVEYRAEKRQNCPKCGKAVKRAKTFMQTLNPFNKNADGFPKSRQQITEELSTEAKTWRNQPELCSKCE